MPVRSLWKLPLGALLPTCLFLVLMCSAEWVPAAPPLTPAPGVFPIGCFPGPPAEANTNRQVSPAIGRPPFIEKHG